MATQNAARSLCRLCSYNAVHSASLQSSIRSSQRYIRGQLTVTYTFSNLVIRTIMTSSLRQKDVKKLKDPAVCRVFYSSPFNGMEGEREELTKRYWPQLTSVCNAAGVRFVPVDMRWGITTDQSSNNQTINICLREIDRSDLFVGFFGQRYGWSGLTDAALQMTFDAAVGRYPWLETVRNRSVTELEFLHGHLNCPGNIPAVICFRDKSYDDKLRESGEQKGDKREVYKYSSESEEATKHMTNLIARIRSTEKDCLALRIGYADPQEGARFMFEHTLKYIKDVLLQQADVEQTTRQKQLAEHSAFMASHSSLYIGGKEYRSKLNAKISQRTDSKPLLIVGEAGSGKTALLCNWIRRLRQQDSQGIYISHFVACSQQSNDPRNILQRMVANLRHELTSNEKGDKITETDYPDIEHMDVIKLANELQTCLKSAESKNLRVVIVVDDLKKIKYREKIVRPLFWLPKHLLPEVHVIVSTDATDKTHVEELVEERGCQTLDVQPLTRETRMEFCKNVLQQRGKTLSDAQLDRVVDAKRTSNPLFLKLVLEELCMFGKFRELDAKTDSLVNCANSTELFLKFLERLETDYNPADSKVNIVEKVMCSLHVSRHGLHESELTEMHEIPSHVWSPLYFALEQFLSKTSGGFLRPAQTALLDAVYQKYIKDREVEKGLQQQQFDFFQARYQNMLRNEDPVPSHWFTELPWLAFKADNKLALSNLILTVPVFLKLCELQMYDLMEYVDYIESSTESLIRKFEQALNVHMADLYVRQEEDLVTHPNVVHAIISIIDTYTLFFSAAKKVKVEEYFLLKIQNILDKASRLSEAYRHASMNQMRYRLACLYVDIKEYDKALPLHQQVLEYYASKQDRTVEETMRLARSYHGSGTAYMALEQYEKAERCFKESMQIHENSEHVPSLKSDVYKSMSCLAHIEMNKGNYELARDKFEEVVEAEEELYKDTMPPEATYTMTNLGICYRRLNQFDKAQEVYKKALKVKVHALGRNHFDVAYAYFNLSNLAKDRAMYDEALEHLRTTLEIFANIDFADSIDAMYAKENMALIYLQQKKLDEGLPYFWDAFNYTHSRDQLKLGLKVVYDNYMIHLLRTEDFEGVRKVSKAMIHCEEMRSFLPYLFLHYVDRLHPSKCDDDVATEEESIDRAIKLYPSTKDLTYQKIELDLLPQKDAQSINTALETYEDSLESFDVNLVIQVCELLESKDWIDGAVEVYEFWLGKFPQSESMLRNLAVGYVITKKADKALECFQRAAEINPEDPILKEKVAYLSLSTGEFDTCRAAIQELETKWSDNEALMKQIALYKKELHSLEQSS